MKSILKFGFAAVIVASTLLSSCGKYEEGPNFSLASKKGRLCRSWTVEKYVDGSTGTEVPCTSGCGTVEYVKDGKIISNGVTLNGVTWAFSKDKSKLEITYGGITTSDIILRLTSKEFWVKDISNSDQTHYKAN